jgi:hypothetical protein
MLFLNDTKSELLNNPINSNLYQFANLFSFFSISLIMFSILLIIGGAFLLKRKRWARNILETTYWLLLIVILFNLIHSSFYAVKNEEVFLLICIMNLPLILLTLIMTSNILMIRNKNLKKLV